MAIHIGHAHSGRKPTEFALFGYLRPTHTKFSAKPCSAGTYHVGVYVVGISFMTLPEQQTPIQVSVRSTASTGNAKSSASSIVVGLDAYEGLAIPTYVTRQIGETQT